MSAKRQLLVETALNLFYKHGINSIGINEVLKVSGVAKKTLYNHFSTKEELILAALQARDEKFLGWLSAELSTANGDKQVISNLFNALHRWFNNQVSELSPFNGCFFINTSAEFSDKSHPINQYCQQHKQAVRELIASHLSSDDEELLTLICVLKEGAIVSASVANELDTAPKCLKIVLRSMSQSA